MLAASTQPSIFDIVVYGATPGGIACALRAAREGLTTRGGRVISRIEN